MNDKQKPNVILIVMDAVRADHLSCYAYHRKTSPNIEKIARNGVLFENAFSAAEWSPPSHASIFTGKYPSFHRTLGRNVFLGEDNITLADVLNLNGYLTIGMSGNMIISPEFKFDKGFQKYVVVDTPDNSFSARARFIGESPKDFVRTLIYGPDRFIYRTNEIIRNFLSKHDRKKPFFMFINFYNCHAPYDPPRPYKKLFCGSFDEPSLFIVDFLSKKILGKTMEKITDRNLDIRKLNYAASDDGQYSFIGKELRVSPEEWEIIRSWYDGEISYLDHRIGELISLLEKKGYLDNTLLILTSDHGESFGEHGLATHQFGLYDSLLQVPLIMTCPGLIPSGKRISSLVSTIDIFPTVLDLLNVRGSDDTIQGRSLSLFNNKKVHDFICAECGESVTNIDAGWFALQPRRPKLKEYDKGFKCLRTKSYKYIVSSDQNEELYDIQKDPFENRNLASLHPEKVEYFRRQLQNTIDLSYFGPKNIPAGEEKKEIVDRLRTLGYL